MSRKAYLQQLVAGGTASPHVAAAHTQRQAVRGRGNLGPATGRGVVKNYDAAMQGRLTTDWQVSRLSADAELQGKLPIIRSRSRDLERNDPYVENYLKLRENNVVGHDGFTLQMKVKLSEDLDPATGEMVVKYDTPSNRKIEKGWKRFCRKNNFLTTRDLNATEACKVMERSIGRDGSILIRKVRGYPNEFGFALQLMEVDYLDDQFIDFRGVACDCPNELTLPDGRPFPYCKTRMHEVRMGVELHGDWMFPVAYWLLAKHPGDYFYGNQFDVRRTRVPVDEIIHPFVHRRAGQTREVPATVAAMLRLQMLGGYDEATLVKARAAAQKMGFLEKEIPDSVADQFMDEWKDAFGDQAVINGEPGQIEELPMGVKFKPWDPQEPTGNYAPFQKTQLRGAACAMGVSYSSLANDPSDSNFSATKIGMMEEREGYRGGQEFFISLILEDIFAAWLPCAMLSQQVDLPFSRLDDFLDPEAVCFGGRSFPWLDPEKDISAAILAIDNGLATRAETIRDGTANDFEEVTADLGREKKVRQAAGIQPPDEAPPQPQEPDKQPDPDDEGAAIKRDGWVTINGRPVHFGPDGKVDSGSGGLLQSAKEKARSAFADKAGEAAFAAGHAAYSAPSPARHATAGAEHRVAAAAHEDAARSGPRATEHAGHAAMHGDKASLHEQLSVASAPKRQRRSFQMPFAPSGSADVLDHIADEGGMASRTAAEKRGHFQNGGRSDYDDAPELKGVYHHAVFGGSMKPDRMAAILHENHGVGDGSVGGMYGEIDKAITTRKAVQQESKRQALEHKQGERFDRDALTPHKGDEAVHVGNLAVGDVLTIHGQKVKVKDIDPDTMDVTLQDHSTYGAQRVQDGQVLYVEKVDQPGRARARGHTEREGGADDLWKPESLGGGASEPHDASTELTTSHGPAKGDSVSKLHCLESNLDPQQLAVISRAHAAIDKAHGIVGADQITETPIRSNPSLRGAKAAYRMRGPFGHMEIIPGRSNELDVIHEMAHALDHKAMGTNGSGLASMDATKLRGIKAAIEKSAEVKTLNRMARNARGGHDRVSQHIVEAAKPYEKFARAYEQYVATKSADPKLLKQLAGQRGDLLGAQKYWSNETFATIVKAFDKHFSSEGWT